MIVSALVESATVYRRLSAGDCGPIARAAEAMTSAVESGHKIILFGNGGSAADAQHIAAEFVGRFKGDRRALPALALTTDTSALTSIGNDLGFQLVFARQLEALATPGDVAIAISTSGRSANVLSAVEAARRIGLVSVGLTGGDGGDLAELTDIAIVAPSDTTSRIQECHIAIGHALCEVVEQSVLGG